MEDRDEVVPLAEITAQLAALAEQARAFCKDLETVPDEDEESLSED
ncbi:hypothetical protein O8B93_27520 [Agrobacterium rhizogenes]|nr:hypothetical protein [Rhizobium rhizogenes]MCZ7451315.1 hypothetical protein [Rhizobium rhizogenes]